MNVRSNKRFGKQSAHRRGGGAGTTDGGYCDATDIEQASRAVNAINARARQELANAARGDREQIERAKITLSPTLDAWLKKEIP